MIYCRSLILAVVVLLASLGCRRDAATSGERTPANPTSPALYGSPTGTASTSIARSPALISTNDSWKSNAFYVLHTELSPATLVHSSTRHLSLFSGMTNYGLGAPKFVAWATMNGPRTFKRGEKLDVSVMAEGWVLVWWAGAEGWTNWDCPWVVYLQHKPDRMALDDDGLHLDFPKEAGDVVMLPVYGYEKLRLEGSDYRAAHKLPDSKVKVKTWEWPTVITRDPLTRIRYWAAVTREFPIYCEESFSVDRAKDGVTIRSRIQRRTITDDWRTRRIKLAPISPSLALAAKDDRFPVQFSERWFDLEMPTPYGPYLGVEGVDEFDATFSVLHYINETESSPGTLTSTNAGVLLARDTIRKLAVQPDASLRTVHGAAWYAKALPYLEPGQRSNVVAQLRSFVRDEALASRDHTGVLEMLWAYAHFTGDWDLVRERWPLVKQIFSAPRQMRWVGFGQSGESSNGDATTHCTAFARLAYKVGDMDSYHYASYAFARELTALAVRQRGAEYFRKHQPWHSMKVMGEEVFATSYQTDGGGWQFAELNSVTRPAVGPIADAVSVLRTNHPIAFERLIPTGSASPFVAGLEREDSVSNSSLIVSSQQNQAGDAPLKVQSSKFKVQSSKFRGQLPTDRWPLTAGLWPLPSELSSPLPLAWPQLTWPAWITPTGARWTFGHIRPVRVGKPTASGTVPLNWNSQAQVCEIP